MRRTLLFVLAAILLAAPILAESVQTFVGNTTGGPTWARPNQGDPPAAGSTTSQYSVQAFKLLTESDCYIVSNQAFDGYIFLYAGGFNPGAPLAGAISGDDDGLLGVGTSFIPHSGPVGPGFTTGSFLDLAAGTYYLVTTGFSSSAFGSFQNSVHCQPTTGSANVPVLVQGSCGFYTGIPVEDAVCFGDRFLTAIFQVSNSSNGGFGVPVRIGSTDTSLFWFFNDTNWEFMVKVLNGCAINNHWWVFGGGLTNQAYNLVITDQDSVFPHPDQRHYVNTLGTRAPAIADTTAFATCP